MATARYPELGATPPISPSDLCKFKVIHTINTVGRLTLLTFYQYYKRFPDSEKIKDHLKCLGITNLKNHFDYTQIKCIEDTPASGDGYDASLLIKCLRVLSGMYEPGSWRKWMNVGELEYKCQKLVDKRNEVFHSFKGLTLVEMEDEIEAIEDFIKDIFLMLKRRFASKISEINIKEKDIEDKIKYICDQPLEYFEIKSYRNQKVFRDQMLLYKRDICDSWGKIKILGFLPKSPHLYNIKDVFTEIIIEQLNEFKKYELVEYTKIINSVSERNILLLNSEVGGGKSTVGSFGLNDWGEGGTQMGTGKYTYIFPMVFRDPHLCSVGDLIGELIPEVREYMGNKDIIETITDTSLDILFFCDGFDERNKKSSKLFDKIVDLKEHHNHIKVIVTSRPEAVQELYVSYGTRLNIDYLKIKGVAEKDRKGLLKKCHDEFRNTNMTTPKTEDLLNFYDSFSAHHKELFHLPTNLVILSWLWGQSGQTPELVKTIKSTAGLYTEVLKMLKKKLRERIFNSPDIKSILYSLGDLSITSVIDSFEKQVFKESINALKFDRKYIDPTGVDPTGVDNLKEVCKDTEVPFLELQGAYLLSSLEWNTITTSFIEHIQFPDQAFMDFYAAKYIESMIVQGGMRIKNLILDLYDDKLNEYKKNIHKFQNVLQYLGGCLALNESSLVEKHAQDMIDLLIETGVSNNEQWYTVYGELAINTTAAEKFAVLIAPKLDLNDFTIKDAEVDILSTLLKYVNVKSVKLEISSSCSPTMLAKLPTFMEVLIKDAHVEVLSTLIKYVNVKSVKLDISTVATHPTLSTLIDVLTTKNCIINISKIEDNRVKLWNSVIKQKTTIIINSLTIKDANVEDCLTLLKYVNVKSVELIISSVATVPNLPSLIEVLTEQNCIINVSKIEDHQVNLWTSVIKQKTTLIINSLLTIKDAYVEDFSTLLRYVDVRSVELNISSVATLPNLPSLIDVLNAKNVPINISNIKDNQVNLWNFSIKQKTNIELGEIYIKNTWQLPFLKYCRKIIKCRLEDIWRTPEPASIDLSGCEIKELWIAVKTIKHIPTTVETLHLGISARDPGFNQLKQRCPQLKKLAVNVKGDTVMKKHPALPDIGSRPDLYLSNLSDPRHVKWSIDCAMTLLPRRSKYNLLVFPGCHMSVKQFKRMVQEMGNAGVSVGAGSVHVSWDNSSMSSQDVQHLEAATRTALQCSLYCYKDDDELSEALGGGW